MYFRSLESCLVFVRLELIKLNVCKFFNLREGLLSYVVLCLIESVISSYVYMVRITRFYVLVCFYCCKWQIVAKSLGESGLC